MKSLRYKHIHYFRNGFVQYTSINKAKAAGFGIGGTSVIHDTPKAHAVFQLDAEIPNLGALQNYHREFQAQLDQLEEMKDKLGGAS